MSENNRVFQVLVLNSGGSVAAKDESINAIGINELGVYANSTGKALDKTALSPEVYLALGIDPGATGAVSDVAFSTGQNIPLKGLKAINYQAYVSPLPMKFTVSGFTASADTLYGLKLEFRNTKIYTRQGYNQYSKSYIVRTSDKELCDAGCPTGDANEVVNLLVEAINTDVDQFVTAAAIAPSALTTATHGTSTNYAQNAVMTSADVLALITFNAAQTTEASKVYAKLQITTNPVSINPFFNVNTHYFDPRQTIIIPSLIEGFIDATITTTQEAVAEQGLGYDIKQKEYHAGGFNGKPGVYRALTATGLAADGYFYLAKETEHYNTFELIYEIERNAGWKTYGSEVRTLVAIPTASTTLLNSFGDILKAIAAQTGITYTGPASA